MTLLELREGGSALVTALRGEDATIVRMNGIGLFANRRIRLLRRAPFQGPILIEDLESGGKMILAKTLARKIEVREIP